MYSSQNAHKKEYYRSFEKSNDWLLLLLSTEIPVLSMFLSVLWFVGMISCLNLFNKSRDRGDRILKFNDQSPQRGLGGFLVSGQASLEESLLFHHTQHLVFFICKLHSSLRLCVSTILKKSSLLSTLLAMISFMSEQLMFVFCGHLEIFRFIIPSVVSFYFSTNIFLVSTDAYYETVVAIFYIFMLELVLCFPHMLRSGLCWRSGTKGRAFHVRSSC